MVRLNLREYDLTVTPRPTADFPSTAQEVRDRKYTTEPEEKDSVFQCLLG